MKKINLLLLILGIGSFNVYSQSTNKDKKDPIDKCVNDRMSQRDPGDKTVGRVSDNVEKVQRDEIKRGCEYDRVNTGTKKDFSKEYESKPKKDVSSNKQSKEKNN